MKNHRRYIILLLAFLFLISCPLTVLAASKSRSDQFSKTIYCENLPFIVTMKNAGVEYWTSYSTTHNLLYEHYNDGVVVQGSNMPFDIYCDNATNLYSGTTKIGSITSWSTYPVMYNPDDIYYPGKSTRQFQAAKSKTAQAKINYGFEAYDGINNLGYGDDSNNFTLW